MGRHPAPRARRDARVLTRQWAGIDGTDTPQSFSTQPDDRIDVTVHQVVTTRDGESRSNATVHHIYRLRDGQIAHMEIRS